LDIGERFPTFGCCALEVYPMSNRVFDVQGNQSLCICISLLPFILTGSPRSPVDSGVAGIGMMLGSVLDEGVVGLRIVPSRYPKTPRDFAAEIIDSFHSAQFELSNFSPIGSMKFAGCDIIVLGFSFGQVCFKEKELLICIKGVSWGL
jgi:hypothetical protein